jgi:hypothetical protein
MTGSDTRYARALVKVGSGPALMTGRSSPIPDAGGTFDLSSEAVPWVFQLFPNPGETISITVLIFQDLGDTGPPAPLLIAVPVADPWKSDTIVSKGPPSVQFRVTTTYINPIDKAFVARASAASGVSATLTAPQGFIVQFTDILGLYKPIFPIPAPPHPGSLHVAGYKSEDNLGRVFTNRIPDGTWKRDTQFIDVRAKVTAFGGPTIPAGAKIRWHIIDPDDPTNDDPHFHRDWGPYVDPNDYDASGKPIGAHAGDNVAAFSPGNTHESSLFGHGVSGTARWATATGGHAPSPSSPSQAESPLTIVDPKTATTSVRVHCLNVLGTNLIIIAELVGTPSGIPVQNAATGVITMWSRLDVEVRRMSSAFSLAPALPKIPQFFWPACVQLDFQLEAPAAVNKQPMSSDANHYGTATGAWVSNVFTHKLKAGWFFVGAAGDAYPKPPAASSHLLSEPATYFLDKIDLGSTHAHPHPDEYALVTVPEIPAALLAVSEPKSVEFTWDVAGKPQEADFGVFFSFASSSGTERKLFLLGEDITPLFTGSDAVGDTGESGAYKSQREYLPQHERHHKGGPLVAGSGGFRVPSHSAHVKVFGQGAFAISGYSPDPPLAGYFGGRTVIFTKFYEMQLVPSPDKPNVLPVPSAGSFATGRDVYLRTTFVNLHGETDMSDSFVFKGTVGNERILVLSPFLTAWHSFLGVGNVPTSYNVYEADVPAGGAAPLASAFKKAASAPLGSVAQVDHTATGPAPPSVNTAAITPSVPSPGFVDDVISTVVHELTHAFGMPHKCGYWDWRTPRRHSCCMNYDVTWLVGPPPDFKLLENTVGQTGNELCGRHLMEVRRVHLERNKALKALGW